VLIQSSGGGFTAMLAVAAGGVLASMACVAAIHRKTA
jgi:hypothetical protein